MRNLNAFSMHLSPWSHWSLSLSKGVAIGSIAVASLLAACGDDSSKTAGGTEEDAGIIAIENKTVSGVSQKGPFVNGSSVKLYEMDGETLAPTGKSFPGKIASDDGRFTVPSISLASQYALLEANGYFRNEITGGKSNGTITLNAFTDLSDREKVNINLLTHLEYERALYLVGTGVKVSEAKKLAESEILDAFEIKGEFKNSEDLDIFSSGDGNAALLAFSVLMLGNLTEADLTERLTNFATDIEQDGKWDDEKTKTIIADWASTKSLEGWLAAIRNNIANWGLSTEVPDFEKYVNNFWWQNYGLGTCSDEREGEIKNNQNIASINANKDYACKSNIWRLVTDLDKLMCGIYNRSISECNIGDWTRVDLCNINNGVNIGCVVGTWSLSGIYSKTDNNAVITNYSNAPGTLVISGDGRFEYTLSAAPQVDMKCGGQKVYGEWEIAEATIKFKVKDGDCMVSVTTSPLVGELQMNMNGVFFQMADVDDESTRLNGTEILVRLY